MATFSTRNIVFVSDENQGLKGKPKPQQVVKRTALKEVGNKVLAQPRGKEADQSFAKVPEKKQITFPTAKFPIVKQCVNKQPTIQVKETKACRLRVQHSRLSIGKVPEKKTVITAPEKVLKEGSVSKNDPTSKITHAVCSVEDLHQCQRPVGSQFTNSTKEKESKTHAVAKAHSIVKEEILKADVIKTDANARRDALGTFSSTLLNGAYVVDIDKDDENDPIMLGMYAKDMYKYLREMELKFPISAQYLKSSKLTGKMRATLIDWLVEVQRDFDMNPETLFLTIAIMDRYLERNPTTPRSQLQLVGTTAMFVASKYEEMMIPDINELVYVSANAYTKREILKMELAIVKSLDCSFGRPLPIHFLRRYSKADQVAPLTHVMAKYIMEMGIMEYDLCHIVPSLLAAASLYISLWLLKREAVWSNNLVKYSGYSINDVLPVVKKLGMLLANSSASKFQAIRKKYSHPKNLQVSALPVLDRLPELVGNRPLSAN